LPQPTLPQPLPKTSNPIECLNFISVDQATDLLNKITGNKITGKKHQKLINPARVDEDINSEELRSFTSVTSKDGK
jgi:hypothetical protein